MEKSQTIEQTNITNEAQIPQMPDLSEPQSEDKKRKGEMEGEKSGISANEENPQLKKTKKEGQGPNFQAPSPEELVSLEALGSVPDVATAFSIASLANQPAQNYTSAPGMISNPADPNSIQMYQQFLMQQAWYLQHMQREMSRVDEGSGYFYILEQPNEFQRKSYKNENRCLLPNPITICCRELGDEKIAEISDASASVCLVNEDGEELPPHKQTILESVEHMLVQNLDETLGAQFSLKVMETSDNAKFRLLFTVRYRMKGVGNCEEKILSTPFWVSSNKKKNVSRQSSKKGSPTPVSIKPDFGEADKEVEVWIKGHNFSDKVGVAFGDKLGHIVETSPNLITVVPPMRDDIHQETPVDVIVSNRYGQDVFSSNKKITYTYLPPK